MHIPVLKKEILDFFQPQPGDVFVDCTAGSLGHTQALEDKGAKVIAIDLEPQDKRVIKANFKDLGKLTGPVKGILFDLGLCSWHLDRSGKGFSFQKDEPLDMRFGDSKLTAEEIVNKYKKRDLIEVFQRLGEEPRAKIIAECIIKNRPLNRTSDLNKCLKSIKTKARIYQALRIAVNDELRNLALALPQAMELADKVAAISYHSLEDRIIKRAFKNKILIRPSPEEVKKNPRARSAKLRIYVKDNNN